jgi:hypothetical protein
MCPEPTPQFRPQPSKPSSCPSLSNNLDALTPAPVYPFLLTEKLAYIKTSGFLSLIYGINFSIYGRLEKVSKWIPSKPSSKKRSHII